MTQPQTCSPDIAPFSNVVKGSTRWTRIRPQVTVSPGAGTCPHRRLIHSHPNIQPPLDPAGTGVSPPHKQLIHCPSGACWKVLLWKTCLPVIQVHSKSPESPWRSSGARTQEPTPHPGSSPGGQPLSVPCFLLPSAWSPKEGWAAIENPNPMLPSWPQFQIPKGRNWLAHLARSAWSVSNNGSPKKKETKGPDCSIAHDRGVKPPTMAGPLLPL